MGMLEQESDRRTLVLTPEGLEALRDGRTIECAKPRTVKKAKRERGAKARGISTSDVDSTLFETLRKLRKTIADDQGVPPLRRLLRRNAARALRGSYRRRSMLSVGSGASAT